jgi:hypothetical protein
MRFVAPLGVAFILIIIIIIGAAFHTTRVFCAYKVAAEARVASLAEKKTMYKRLAERWAPLSFSVAIAEDEEMEH